MKLSVWGANRAEDRRFHCTDFVGRVVSIPCESEAGGDLHYITVDNGNVAGNFLLLDVSGHGQAAAGLCNLLRDSLDNLVKQGNYPALFDELNRLILTTPSWQIGKYATAVAGIYTTGMRLWHYAYAGHPSMLLRTADGWSDLPGPAGRSVPMGVVENAVYSQSSITTSCGDCILIFTDGLTDLRGRDGTRLGVEGLQRMLDGDEDANMNALYERVLEPLLGDDSVWERTDDISIVLLQFL